MKIVNENGIGSNYKTLNNNPVSPFHDERVKVEMFPSAWGKFSVDIRCEDLGFSSGLREFNSEQEAKLFAINTVNKLVSEMDSILEAVIQRLLVNQ